uniref:50S ribosomal protein L22, chloroplastic n=1 Tax=Tetradium ruticarpum TaxID=354523 RepID=A0A7G9TZ07_9ROSI|nr:ribosomal protein L22 [Tetradium ruticarpum]QNN85633.1 ribosomal protein L22 [Tetradium ruticarpum]
MIRIIKKKVEVSALGQHICMSAHKARRVIDQIRGRSYEETLMILELMPYRACYPILKLVYSAAANGIHNLGFNERTTGIEPAHGGFTIHCLDPLGYIRPFNSVIYKILNYKNLHFNH